MHVLQLKMIRKQSQERAADLGYDINESLPLLDEIRVGRSATVITSRLFAMLCVAACAYGFDRKKAISWLEQQGSYELLSTAECRYLKSGVGDRQRFMHQIEGMWALGWCINVVPEMDFGQPCSQDFISYFPDLKKGESGELFRSKASLRSDESIASQCDLSFCLHWSIVHAELQKKKAYASVKPFVVIERRRAFEWILTGCEWDEVALDT